MSALTIRLDPRVEVLNDDQGRIVLLPPDHRSPIRLPPGDEALVQHLRNGACDLEGRSDSAELSLSQRGRFHAIAVASDKAGLLAGRRVAPPFRTVRFDALTRTYDAFAGALARPLLGAMSVQARGRLLLAFTLATVAGLAVVWWLAQGRMFAAALSPYWLLAVAVYLVAFPLIHEFSHALVARLFGLQVTTVGAQHRGGMSWAPFVEVRHAVLSSDPTIRIWIPLAGVICNLFLSLMTGIWLLASAPGSAAAGVAGLLTLLLHIRVLIDGGRGVRTDASQALRISSELQPAAAHRRLMRAVRIGHMVFFFACMCMLALSFRDLRI